MDGSHSHWRVFLYLVMASHWPKFLIFASAAGMMLKKSPRMRTVGSSLPGWGFGVVLEHHRRVCLGRQEHRPQFSPPSLSGFTDAVWRACSAKVPTARDHPQAALSSCTMRGWRAPLRDRPGTDLGETLPLLAALLSRRAMGATSRPARSNMPPRLPKSCCIYDHDRRVA